MIDGASYDAPFCSQSKVCLRGSTSQSFLLFGCARMYEIVEPVYVLGLWI